MDSWCARVWSDGPTGRGDGRSLNRSLRFHARVAPTVVSPMSTQRSDRNAPITESRAYRRLQFLKLVLTVVTLVVTIWKAVTGSVP